MIDTLLPKDCLPILNKLVKLSLLSKSDTEYTFQKGSLFFIYVHQDKKINIQIFTGNKEWIQRKLISKGDMIYNYANLVSMGIS